MTKSTATIPVPEVRLELEKRFDEWARVSFTNALEAMNTATFYKTVLRRLDDKTDITDEVPEMVGMDEQDVRDVVQSLHNKSKSEMTETWELDAIYQPCFLTTVRSVTPADELLPQYDVEYAGKDDYAGAKVRVKTWRRNLTVEVIGTDKELETLSIHMSQAAMLAAWQ
jgi:hypothetical protein